MLAKIKIKRKKVQSNPHFIMHCLDVDEQKSFGKMRIFDSGSYLDGFGSNMGHFEAAVKVTVGYSDKLLNPSLTIRDINSSKKNAIANYSKANLGTHTRSLVYKGWPIRDGFGD